MLKLTACKMPLREMCEVDRAALDKITLAEVLAIVRQLLTNDQLNTLVTTQLHDAPQQSIFTVGEALNTITL